jgi:hypothetical protein
MEQAFHTASIPSQFSEFLVSGRSSQKNSTGSLHKSDGKLIKHHSSTFPAFTAAEVIGAG